MLQCMCISQLHVCHVNKLRMEVEDVLGRGNSLYVHQFKEMCERIYEREFGVAAAQNERGRSKNEAGQVGQIMINF